MSTKSVSPDFFKNLKVPLETPEEQYLENEKQKMLEWLRKTDLGQEFDGKYVAIYHNDVLSSGDDLENVEKEALFKSGKSRKEILIHFIPFRDQIINFSEKKCNHHEN